MRWVWTLTLLLLPSSLAASELKIKNLQLLNGIFGPAREAWEFYPVDRLVLRFQVEGVSTDEKNNCEGEFDYQLVDEDGVTVLKGGGPLRRQLMLGGSEVPCSFFIVCGPNTQPGNYSLKVHYRDTKSKQTADFEQKLVCKEPKFRIVTPSFYHDKEGKIPAGSVKTVGEALFFRAHAVGFDKSEAKAHVTVTVQLFDENDVPMLSEPLTFEVKVTKPEDVAKAEQINFSGAVGLNRAGTFKLKITIQDQFTDATDSFETALRVMEP